MQRGRYIPVHKCLSEILVKIVIDAGLFLFSHSEALIRFLPFNVLQRG